MKKAMMLLLVITLTIALSACSGKIYNSKYFEVTKLVDGVYSTLASSDKESNSGIIDLGDEVLVIDTMNSKDSAADLKKAAETLTGKKVAYVVNTHGHQDHITGNSLFKETTRIITTKRVNEDIKKAGGTDATETFEKERTIKGSKRSVRIMDFGYAHSASDSIVYLPEDKIVFMGDFKYVLSYGDPTKLESVLNEIVKLNGSPELNGVVWGHGPGTKDDIKLLLKFMDWGKAAVKSSLEKGETIDQAQETPLPKEFTWDKEVERMSRDYLKYMYRITEKNFRK